MNDPAQPNPEKDPDPIERLRTKEPQAPFGGDEPNPNVVSDATAEERGPGEPVDPGIGGYAGRDPKTDMPAMPSIPETQDDARSHDAAPSPSTPERQASD